MERQAKDGTYYKQVGPDDWEVVTRTAKDGTVYKKVGPDEWESLSPKEMPERPWYSASPEGLLKGAIETLPAIGGLGGGALGMASPIPGGAIAGGIGGAMLGKQAQQIAEGLIWPETKEQYAAPTAVERQMQLLKGPLFEGAIEAVSTPIGEGLAKVAKPIGKMVNRQLPYLQPWEEAPEVIKAGVEEGLEVTPGMSTTSPVLGKLEASLAQEPTFLSEGLRRQRGEFFEGVNKKVEDFATGVSDYNAGMYAKEKIAQQVEEKFAPAKELYDRVEDYLLDRPVSKGASESILDGLRDSRVFRDTQGKAQLESLIKDFPNSFKTLQDVKLARTEIGESLNTLSGIEKTRAQEIYNALTDIRNASMRQSSLDDLVLADSVFKGEIQDLNKLKKLVGKSKIGSEAEFVKALNELPEGKIVDRVFRQDTLKVIEEVQKQFPEVYESLKKAKLQELYNSGFIGSNFSPKKYLNNIYKLPDQFKAKLFSPEDLKTLENLRVLVNSIPEVGRSGTPEGLAYREVTDLIGQISSVGPWALYKSMTDMPSFTQGLGRAIGGASKPMAVGALPFTNLPILTAAQMAARGIVSPFRSDQGQPQKRTFTVSQENMGQYIKDTMSDPNLNSLEKMKRVKLLREQGLGIAEMSQAPVSFGQEMVQPKLDAAGAANLLKQM